MAPKGNDYASKYEPEYCALVIEKMGEGLSKEAFAGFIGVTRKTLYNWRDNIPEFKEALEIGETKCLLFWESLSIEYKTNVKEGPNLNTTAWIFNMKNRFKKEWSDRYEVDKKTEHSGSLKVKSVEIKERLKQFEEE